jgi:hypothetical protein
MTKTPKIDYEQVEEKLRKELYIAKNLNESLAKDKNELLEQNWKLKQRIK